MKITTNIQLSLIEKWFKMTESGEKKEDYRETNAYWCCRLLLFKGSTKSVKFWDDFLTNYVKDNKQVIRNYIDLGESFTFKKFETNIMTLGYPRSTYTDRILKYKHAGIEIRTGNTSWGAEVGKLYFVIKHGERL